jgi:hypothetical protein
METKLRQNKIERVRIKLGFPSMFVVESVGRSGGLALFWSSEVVMEIINFSRRHIYAKVLTAGRGLPWKLTSFYGHLEASKRHEAWSLLRFLASLTPSPWVCVGDFNELLDLSKKIWSIWMIKNPNRGF